MRSLIFTVAILASLSAINAYTFGLGEKFECFRKAEVLQSRIYENEIKAAIEEFRDKLKTEGIPEVGIPPLDPLDLEDERVQLENELINLDLNLTAHSKGLASFEVVKVKMSLIGLKFEVDLHFPEITLSAKYGLLADTSLAPIQVFGNGDIDATATDFTIAAQGKVGTKLTIGGLKIILDKLEVDINLDKIDFKITGLLGSDEVSEMISGAISAGLPKVLTELNDEINEILKVVVDKINDILINSRTTLPDLNDFMNC